MAKAMSTPTLLDRTNKVLEKNFRNREFIFGGAAFLGLIVGAVFQVFSVRASVEKNEAVLGRIDKETERYLGNMDRVSQQMRDVSVLQGRSDEQLKAVSVGIDNLDKSLKDLRVDVKGIRQDLTKIEKHLRL